MGTRFKSVPGKGERGVPAAEERGDAGEELEGLSFVEPIMSAAGVGGHADCGADESTEEPRRSQQREREREGELKGFGHFSLDFGERAHRR